MLLLVLGVLAITTEFRHGTSNTTFLATPRRYPVMAAKLGAVLGSPAGSSFAAWSAALVLIGTLLIGRRDLNE